MLAAALALAVQPQLMHPQIIRLTDQLFFSEGPVWDHKNKRLVFSDIPRNKILQWDGKELRGFQDESRGTNGNTIDAKGNIYSCEHTGRAVVMHVPGEGAQTIARTFDGKRFNSPNDLTIHPKLGLLLFTDPTYGLGNEKKEMDGNYVYQVNLKTKAVMPIYKGRNQPNGIVFSPDRKTLYVADSQDGKIDVFAYSPNKMLTPKATWEAPMADGLRVDVKGNVWAACRDGVRVYSPKGDLLVTQAFPEIPANLAFGEDGKTLFVTARRGLYRVQTFVKGVMPGLD